MRVMFDHRWMRQIGRNFLPVPVPSIADALEAERKRVLNNFAPRSLINAKARATLTRVKQEAADK